MRLLYILILFLFINTSNAMILDEKYSSYSNKSILEVLNKEIDESYSLSLLAVDNLEDTKNINIQIKKIQNILDNGLSDNIENIIISIENSNNDKNLINSLLNLSFLINSVSDKVDMILGGASPIAMSFYSEEIVKHFNNIFIGIDKNNNGTIENNLGEGCLNYLNSISEKINEFK